MDMKLKPDQGRKAGAQEGTRRVILDKAASLFRARGYASTSLRDIAAATGLKAGSIYYHYASKEELAEEVLSEGIALVENQVKAATGALAADSDPLEVIRVAMIAHLQALHVRGDYASANIRCYNHVPPDVKRRLRRIRASYEEFWEGLIACASAAGRLKDGTDPVALRYALIGMLNWTLEWRKSSSPTPKDLGDALFRIAFEGVEADGRA
jgi:AcrR family transcriptional regulator